MVCQIFYLIFLYLLEKRICAPHRPTNWFDKVRPGGKSLRTCPLGSAKTTRRSGTGMEGWIDGT